MTSFSYNLQNKKLDLHISIDLGTANLIRLLKSFLVALWIGTEEIVGTVKMIATSLKTWIFEENCQHKDVERTTSDTVTDDNADTDKQPIENQKQVECTPSTNRQALTYQAVNQQQQKLIQERAALQKRIEELRLYANELRGIPTTNVASPTSTEEATVKTFTKSSVPIPTISVPETDINKQADPFYLLKNPTSDALAASEMVKKLAENSIIQKQRLKKETVKLIGVITNHICQQVNSGDISGVRENLKKYRKLITQGWFSEDEIARLTNNADNIEKLCTKKEEDKQMRQTDDEKD